MRKRLDEMKKGDAWVVGGTRYEFELTDEIADEDDLSCDSGFCFV